VLCEKPLAMTLSQAAEMARAADAAGVPHIMAFTYRFVPAMRYIAYLVTDGFVGEPWHSARSAPWTGAASRSAGASSRPLPGAGR
jgi:predicted dehydrogenase